MSLADMTDPGEPIHHYTVTNLGATFLVPRRLNSFSEKDHRKQERRNWSVGKVKYARIAGRERFIESFELDEHVTCKVACKSV